MLYNHTHTALSSTVCIIDVRFVEHQGIVVSFGEQIVLCSRRTRVDGIFRQIFCSGAGSPKCNVSVVVQLTAVLIAATII